MTHSNIIIPPDSQFFETGEDEQALLVRIPPGFAFSVATEHSEGFITDLDGKVIFNALRDPGSILRIVLKRQS